MGSPRGPTGWGRFNKQGKVEQVREGSEKCREWWGGERDNGVSRNHEGMLEKIQGEAEKR